MMLRLSLILFRTTCTLAKILQSTISTLSDYVGRHALVQRLALPENESVRLKSLGLFVGQEITIQRTGSAVIVSAAGGRVAISDEIAKQIFVQHAAERVA